MIKLWRSYPENGSKICNLIGTEMKKKIGKNRETRYIHIKDFFLIYLWCIICNISSMTMTSDIDTKHAVHSVLIFFMKLFLMKN